MQIELPNWIEKWTTPKRYKIAYGGRGSAKSWSIARLLLLRAMMEPTRVLCAREYQASIADSVHKLLSDTIRNLELPGFNVLKTEITHENGSVFFFRGLARNPHSIKSSEGISIVWVEEAHAVTEDSWRQLIPTIRAEDSEIWITYNPRYIDDPTCQRFYGPNAPPNAIVCEVNHDKNPWFPSVLKDEMDRDYSRDPEVAEHIWGGKPLQFSNAQVLKGKWIVQDFTPDKTWDGPYFGIDWGITDPTAVVKCWLNGDALYIERELYARGVQDMAGFIDQMPGLKSHVSRADNAWPETINTLRRGGFRLLEAVKKWPGSVDDGVFWLRSRPQIVIHTRCKNTIEEAGLWRFKTDNAGNIQEALVDANNHAWDAIRYAMQQHIRARPGGRISNG